MFLAVSPKEIKIPVIVKAELLLGAYKSQVREKTVQKVEKFLEPFEILPFTNEIASEYAEIRKKLESEGSIIGANDLFIAAAVKSKNGILVTHNTGEFSRISRLAVEDWVKE